MNKSELMARMSESKAKARKALDLMKEAETYKELKFYRSAFDAHMASIRAIRAMMEQVQS